MSEQLSPTQQAQKPRRWRIVGPGLVVAATGVGAGDLVSTMVAGSSYGYALLWAAVLGCVVKIALAEATGRWHLATQSTIFAGWASLGSWTAVYFGIYVVVFGFVYGSAATQATALPLAAMFPQVPFNAWAIGSGVLGLVLVWLNRYAVIEKIMAVLVGVMFVSVVSAAVLTVPSLPDLAGGLVPSLPDGSAVYTLGLIGGVGGTITIAAYGYWVQAKGWSDSSWLRVMRLDNTTAYVMTGIFVISMLIVGAELLSTIDFATEDEEALLRVAPILDQEYGEGMRWLFLVGFFATSFTSVIGTWNGVGLMFADFAASVNARMRGREIPSAEQRATTTSPWFRGYVLWMTFPPMLLLLLGEPIAVVIAYGVLGAVFLPFLALTLVWLLNSSRVPQPLRNGWVSNTVLVLAALLFFVVAYDEISGLIADYF
jgi:Mn2+/Fe2+ NRAMP family transporter